MKTNTTTPDDSGISISGERWVKPPTMRGLNQPELFNVQTGDPSISGMWVQGHGLRNEVEKVSDRKGEEKGLNVNRGTILFA